MWATVDEATPLLRTSSPWTSTSQGNYSSLPAPTHLFIEYPGGFGGIAFNANDIKAENGGGALQLPEALLVRDDPPSGDSDEENQLRDSWLSRYENELIERFYLILDRRSRMFALLLLLDIFYCSMVLLEVPYLREKGGGQMMTLIMIMVMNIGVDIVTLYYGVGRHGAWAYDLFILTEGASILFLLFNYAASFIVIIRFFLVLFALQIRAMLRRRDADLYRYVYSF